MTAGDRTTAPDRTGYADRLGMLVTMLVSIDRAGRIVIPKDIRDQLALEANTELEVTVDGRGLLLSPVRRPGRRIVEVDGWPVLEAIPGLSVSDADVQRWRDDGQR